MSMGMGMGAASNGQYAMGMQGITSDLGKLEADVTELDILWQFFQLRFVMNSFCVMYSLHDFNEISVLLKLTQ